MAGPSGSTPNRHYPYPLPDDTFDTPRDIKALALALDTGDLPVVSARAVLDVGASAQIRAGRDLTPADFTNMGLSAPVGLWNLANLNDSSGNARNLVNKGTVTFDKGIGGALVTAAFIQNDINQVLYIPEASYPGVFQIRTGSMGCWFKTARRGVDQCLISKIGSTNGTRGFFVGLTTANNVYINVYPDGTNSVGCISLSDVADDRWHFVVATIDGASLRIYVDGVLETMANGGLIFPVTAPFNIGGAVGESSVNPLYSFQGKIDETFITSDILSDDQVRNLYCAKIPHTLGVVPTRVNLNVRRRRRGGALVTGDFPTAGSVLRLYNFTAGALTDAGVNAAALTNNGSAVLSPGVDGAAGNAFSFIGAQSLSATDASLPTSATGSRSYGCWFKTTLVATNMGLISWGNLNGNGDARLWVASSNAIAASNGADNMSGGFVADGQWHFVVAVETNTFQDGTKRKLYLDGKLVASSAVENLITLAGANHFRIGAMVDGTGLFTGQIDSAFVYNNFLTSDDILKLYNKGSQALAMSPKNLGDHIEAMNATDILVNFESLEGVHQVDLGVAV